MSNRNTWGRTGTTGWARLQRNTWGTLDALFLLNTWG